MDDYLKLGIGLGIMSLITAIGMVLLVLFLIYIFEPVFS